MTRVLMYAPCAMVESINLLFIFFLILLFSVLVNTNTSLHLLLTAELLWITIYAITFFIGLHFDNLNVLSLTFFSLVLSAVEFSFGVILILFQNVITRTISIFENDFNFLKFLNRFKSKFYINKIKWKI